MELIILDENSSFSEWANKWKTRKIVGISKAYQTAVNSQVNYLTNFFGDISINRIKPMHIDELISKLAIENPKTHRPSSKKLLKEVKNTAVNIFEYAADNSDYDRNPALKIKIPKNAPKNTRRALTDNEIHWIVNTPHRARIAAIIMTFCGLRSGEVIPLQWTDIDFEKSSLSVIKSVERVSSNKYNIKSGTKNDKSRVIPIPKELLEELKQYKTQSISRFVCSDIDEDMHTPSSWKRLWESFNNVLSHHYATLQQSQQSIYNPKGIKKRVDKITPHMFRHTYATMLYCSGVDVLSAQRLLGHSDVSTTLSIYTHLEQSKMDISISAFCEYISSYFS